MVINWIPLETIESVNLLRDRSFEIPCLIFKHSTRCSISSIAQYRLEKDWIWAPSEMNAFVLDVLKFRSVSLFVADEFQVHHQSPQLLLIQNGECIYDASHLDITKKELKEALTGIYN